MRGRLSNHGVRHWSNGTLIPALIIGWFSWWIWIRFVLDLYGGAWGIRPWVPLYYFNPDYQVMFGSIPDMLFWITVAGWVIAVPVLILTPVKTWSGRVMTLLAHAVIMLSVAYTVAVERQEAASAQSTWLLINSLERMDELDWLDQHTLERAKEIFSRYEENHPDRW